MKKDYFFVLSALCLLVTTIVVNVIVWKASMAVSEDLFVPEVAVPSQVRTKLELPDSVQLFVPYVSEAPGGNWAGPWKNGCEEAAVVMVGQYYRGKKTVSTTEAKALMQQLFVEQDKEWGSNANSDAARTKQFVEALALFRVTIKEDPTVEDIKKEVLAGHPVITLHKGFDLGNKNIPFLATGSSYHTLVVIGYDETMQQFITNDDGDVKEGAGRRYDYNLLMNSLHDYNYVTKQADGPPRALFTAPW